MGVVYSASSGQTVACEEISLTVQRGECVTIIGPSGCGKSTALHALGGMLEPTTGWVSVDGQKVEGPNPRNSAFVFQDYSLLPWKTVIENVEIGLIFSGEKQKPSRVIASEKLATVGLSNCRDMYPRQLSGGMQQRVAVARALAMEPKYLLMDEPFGALDEQTRRNLGIDLGKTLSDSERGVVLITHSLEEAIFWADRILVMASNPGRIIKEIHIPSDRPRPAEFMTSSFFADVRAELLNLIRLPAAEDFK